MTATLPGSGMDAWRSQSRKGAYAASVPAPPGGNTPWARAYGLQIKQLIERQASRAPRSLQVHLGPSELGVHCHRSVVGRMTAEPRTNHVSHPWPAIIGTAVHAWLAGPAGRERPDRRGAVPDGAAGRARPRSRGVHRRLRLLR